MSPNTITPGQQYGTTPQGQIRALPIGGAAPNMPITTPLAANAVATSGWIDTSGYGSVLYVLRADVASAIGGIIVETSDDGLTAVMTGAGISYTQLGIQIQRVFVPKGRYTRITYTNGATAQTYFRFEVKLSTTLVQPTEGSYNVNITDTSLAMYVKSDIEAPDDSRIYDQIKRTGNALRVYVDNATSATDVSLLAKESGGNLDTIVTKLTSILAKIISNPATETTLASVLSKLNAGINIGNFPATQPVSATALPLPAGAATENTLASLLTALNSINVDQGAPADAQATNSTASWGEIALLKGILQRPANSSITNVTTLATSVLLLAANASRKGASIFSISGTILISLGSQNNATLFTGRIITNAVYEVPFGYTGAIYGIGVGSVSVTELS